MPSSSASKTTAKMNAQDSHVVTSKMDRIRMGGKPGPNNSFPTLSHAAQAQAIAAQEGDAATHQTATSLTDQADEMRKKSAVFQTVSKMMGQLNESMNANTYLRDNLAREVDRVKRLNFEARRDTLAAQQRHLTEAYNKNYAEFKSRVVVFVLGCSAVMAMLVGAWVQGAIAPWAFYVAAVVAVLLFLGAMYVIVGNYTRRRKLHWDEYYWTTSPVQQNNNSSSDGCSNDEND